VRARAEQAGIATLEGRSIDEIAGILDVSPGCVRRYLHEKGGECGPHGTSGLYQAHVAKVRAANLARDNRIGDLWREGSSTAEIAGVVGLCREQVSRIIRIKGFSGPNSIPPRCGRMRP
jgi:transposase